MVRNLPANGGDTGLIPGPGGSHGRGAIRPACHTTEPIRQSLGTAPAEVLVPIACTP